MKPCYVESPRYKSVAFVHIPKTGGCSIREALGMSKTQHHVIASQLPADFRFAFVRNPYERLLSAFAYETKVVGVKRNGFRYFVLNELRETIHGRDHLYWPQYYYLDERLDFKGHYECLEHDFNILCDILGLERRPLPHNNQSPHGTIAEHYDTDLMYVVRDLYEEDFIRCGYSLLI